MAKEKSEIKRDILVRVRWLHVLFVLLGISIFAKIIYIQYGPEGNDLRAKARKITFERVKIPADRGDILAVDGRILATSVPTYEIRMDFAADGLIDSVFNSNVDSLALRLSHFFGDKSKDAYVRMLRSARANKTKNRYKLLSPRRIDHLELAEVTKFPLFRLGRNKSGLITPQINKRLRPHGSLASRTIGSVNMEGRKIGIEGAFNDHLAGEDGSALMQKISGSFRIPVSDPSNVEPVNGIDVLTTIDVDIQDVAENALRQQLELGKANWGSVVLMEVATGEIRAMSNITRKSEGNCVEDYNYAIGMSLEPGSTFKLASLITLLDDAKMSLDEVIDTGTGTEYIGKAKVVDTHGVGVASLRDIFKVSSNVGFAKAVHSRYADNPGKFVDNICKLGFDKPMGMQISGESKPTVKHPGERWWDGTTLVMMSYGYALNITPMHTLSLYNAVANNGKMVRPILVKELREYGRTIKKFDTEVINPQICSEETISKVKECLEEVVDEGTARGLRSSYYKVAAKTGTAQVAQGRYGYKDPRGGRHYLATMVGYFPADNPKYSCIVCVKTYYGPGSYGTYYGASLSGPVFKAIADRVYASQTKWQKPISDNPALKNVTASKMTIPLKGGNLAEIRRIAKRFSIDAQYEGKPQGWAQAKVDSSRVELEKQAIREGVVPDVRGYGLKEALYVLENSGLRVAFSGKGSVVSQSREPGTQFSRGAMISVKLDITRNKEDKKNVE